MAQWSQPYVDSAKTYPELSGTISNDVQLCSYMTEIQNGCHFLPKIANIKHDCFFYRHDFGAH